MQDPQGRSNASMDDVGVNEDCQRVAASAAVTAGDARRPRVRHVRHACAAAALVLLATCTAYADTVQREVRLLTPYPLTGPRDVQGIERRSRSYQAIAPHALPAISELMTQQAVAAIQGRDGPRVTRERVSRLTPARLEALIAATDAAPHTLLLGGTDSVVIAPLAGRAEPRAPWRELAVIAPIAVMPFVLLCARQACTDGRLRAAMREGNGHRPAYYASSGELGLGHLGAELLRRSLGLEDALHVPYNGGNAALNGLIAGQVDWMLAALPLALPYVEGGKIAALGLAAGERFALLPRLPTLAEAGFGEHVVEAWFGLFASPRMPAALATELRERVLRAGQAGAARSALLLRGLVPATESASAFAARISADAQRWGALMDGLATP